jgi:hypothetical protein
MGWFDILGDIILWGYDHNSHYFMFILVYLEVRPTFLWLLSMVLSSFSQSHWHCLCWVLVKIVLWVLSFSLCSCGNKNLLVSYGEHNNRFWRWPLSKVTSIIKTNKCWNYVVSGGKHAWPIQGHPKFFYDVVMDLLNNLLGEMMKVKHSTLPTSITLFLYAVGILC